MSVLTIGPDGRINLFGHDLSLLYALVISSEMHVPDKMSNRFTEIGVLKYAYQKNN